VGGLGGGGARAQYIDTGHWDTAGKADVYGFGVLLCELLTGRLQSTSEDGNAAVGRPPPRALPGAPAGRGKMVNLVKVLARKAPPVLESAADPRAGAWAPAAAAEMADWARHCTEEARRRTRRAVPRSRPQIQPLGPQRRPCLTPEGLSPTVNVCGMVTPRARRHAGRPARFRFARPHQPRGPPAAQAPLKGAQPVEIPAVSKPS
jgi:hypothetical protein